MNLPTSHGSVVRTTHGKTALRTDEEGLWPWRLDNGHQVADGYFKGGFTVIFNAPTDVPA